jgi:hypothetical protein
MTCTPAPRMAQTSETLTSIVVPCVGMARQREPLSSANKYFQLNIITVRFQLFQYSLTKVTHYLS